MKILFLAPANNYHTQKWCGYFVSKGYEVHVISFFPGEIEGVTVHFLDCGVNWQQSDRKKLKYLLKTPKIRHIVAEIAPDIIGLEEVDIGAERSGGADEAAELARLAGFSYYVFARAIPLGAGEYGTAILSRYPIESFEVIPLESGNGEDRTLGHAVISIANQKVDVFVTHLSFEDRSLRIEQMDTISDNLGNSEHYILLGDFNSFDLEDVMYLGGFYYVNRPDRRYTTFRRYDLAIDNIIVSRSFTELSSALSDRECSDHKLLYASFQFTP